MSDLHAAIVAKIDELEAIADACIAEAPGDWRADHNTEVDFIVEAWDDGPDATIMITGSAADARHVATWDPATVLRGLVEDRDILARHVAAPSRRGRPPVCTEDMHDLPCPDLLGLARRHGVAPVPGGES